MDQNFLELVGALVTAALAHKGGQIGYERWQSRNGTAGSTKRAVEELEAKLLPAILSNGENLRQNGEIQQRNGETQRKLLENQEQVLHNQEQGQREAMRLLTEISNSLTRMAAVAEGRAEGIAQGRAERKARGD